MYPDPLELEEKRSIFNFILQNPGIHLRQLARSLDTNLSTLRYRLDTWEKQGLIVSKKEQNLKVYYASHRVSNEDKPITLLLQQKRFRDIIVTILSERDSTHHALQHRLNLKPSTLTKYLQVIEAKGVISIQRQGRKKRYRIVDEERIIRLLMTYKKSFWDAFVDCALEIYFER